MSDDPGIGDDCESVMPPLYVHPHDDFGDPAIFPLWDNVALWVMTHWALLLDGPHLPTAGFRP
jgi:hypothetical protein